MTLAPTITWSSLFEAGRLRLIAAVPQVEALEHPMITVLAHVLGLAECRFATALAPHTVDATVTTTPTLSDDPVAAALLDLVAASITAPARTVFSEAQFPIGQKIDDEGFVSFVIQLLGAGATQQAIMDMARIVSAAIETLATGVRHLAEQHLRSVLDRDIPIVSQGWKSLSSIAVWLLATDIAGDPRRPETIKRRLQAFRLFAALDSVLTDPLVTSAIDNGIPLIPTLANHLDLTEAEVRGLRGAFEPDPFSYRSRAYILDGIQELKAHSVPLCEWPGGGKPDQPQAWKGTPWLETRKRHLLRPDLADPADHEAQDAINGFRYDILRPIAANRAAQLPPDKSHCIQYFLADLDFPLSLRGSEERRDFLTAIRQVLMGRRRSKSFNEAVALWHRKAATIAAVRHEARTNRPGWPAICQQWQSRDGRHSLVPLTTAAHLVEEGNALIHCVGAYYDACRRGETQILSLRRDGVHTATTELLLSGDKALSIKVGQFKSRCNSRPDEPAHGALQEFLAAINNGDHPIDRKRLVAYRKAMRDVWDGGCFKDLSLAHARKVFPLYLPLLPRGTPETFDAWYAGSGLEPVMDRALMAIAGLGDLRVQIS